MWFNLSFAISPLIYTDIASAWSEAYIYHFISIHITLLLSTLSRQSFMKKAYRSFKNLIKRLITFTSLLNWRVHVPMCLECLRASRVNVSFKLAWPHDHLSTCLACLVSCFNVIFSVSLDLLLKLYTVLVRLILCRLKKREYKWDAN